MELYPSVIADECLGVYIHKPELMVNSKYPIRKEDFIVKLHQIVFVTIYNLYTNGCQNITLLDINEWLKPYEAQYNIYKDNKGDEYISTILEITDEGNFEYYYSQLRKFSCLRDYKEKGYNVNKFYDITKSEESQLENLNKYSVQDIINYFDSIQLNIRQEYLGASSEIEENQAGDGLDDFLNQLEEKPLYGVSFLSDNLNAVTRGMIDGQLSCFSSPSGEGKAQPVDTIIPTPNGYTRLGDIKVGDYVYDRYGKPTKVLGVYPQGIMDEYRVTLKDGRSTICNNNHLWSIFRHYGGHTTKNNIMEVVDTNEIIELLNRYTVDGKRKNTISIPTNSAIEYEQKKYDIDPYVIGSFLGNGCCTENLLTYSSADTEQVEEVSRLIGATPRKNKGKNYSWTFEIDNTNYIENHKNSRNKNTLFHTNQYFANYIDNICQYSYNKSIPNDYKYGSIKQRYDLLQGLFDTDGHISKDKIRHNITYSTTSLTLAKDVMEVLYSLGYSASLAEDTRKKNKHIYYTVRVLIDNSEKPKLFRLSRKRNIAIEASKKLTRRHYDRIAITKIEKLNTQSEMVCIYVDNEEHLYLTNDYIVTHNTSVCAGIMARLCATRVWDDATNTFISNPYKTRNGGLYIQFELDNITELSLKFLGYITNIPVNAILDGRLTQEQKDRLSIGKEILKESNIHMVYAPNFTKQSIDDSVKSHIIKYGIDLFIMDYIQDVSSLNAEMVRANGGVGLRTDQVLAGLSAFLKEVARRYNIPVYTCTQTNANLGANETIGVESIAGSRAVANKLDVGGVFLGLRPKEEKALQEIELQLHERGFNKYHPTHIYHMYKTRFGSYPQNIKIWVNFDKGTCRMRDCFCTDWKNQLISVKPVSLIKNEEAEQSNNMDDIF